MDLTAIDFLGLDRVLKRGTGRVIEQQDQAVLVRDSVSGALLLGCTDARAGAAVLARRAGDDCRLLMVSDRGLGQEAYRRYGFAAMLECRQFAYYGAAPVLTGNPALRDAQDADLPLLIAAYDLVSAEELKRIVARKKLMLGCKQGKTVGFIGEHLEGGMGLLYVFPEHRRQGYALELEKAMIAKTLHEGYIPFGQVEKSNRASLALQRKLGMTVSDRLICWMWK